MLTGLGVTIYYMVINVPWVRSTFGLVETGLWWGIQPVSAGVFGVAAGVIVTVLVSWATGTSSGATSVALPDPRKLGYNLGLALPHLN